jgi:hypothetical protein
VCTCEFSLHWESFNVILINARHSMMGVLHLPPCRGGLRRHHVSDSSGPCLSTEESSDAATCPVALWGPRATSVKKIAVGPAMHLRHVCSQGAWHHNIYGLRFTKAHAHGSATVVGKGRMHLTSATVTIKASIMCRHATTLQCQPPQAVDHPCSWLQWWCDPIGWHHAADHV